MKNNFLIILLLFINLLNAQNKTISKHSFTCNTLEESTFKDFMAAKLQNSQFTFIGEQHGIKEVGEITNEIYNLASPLGYNTLCIETDAVAANIISDLYKNSKPPIDATKNLFQEYPYSIPFYNNSDDIKLFKNVIDSGGKLLGIDQTFMVQFRLNFNYLIQHTKSNAFKKRLIQLKEKAEVAYQKAITEKNYMAPFIFNYDLTTHNELLQMAKTEEEKNIIKQFLLTQEIYSYNFTKQYYLNNNSRASLMKTNFIQYYKNALINEKTPKVLFKLGSNHIARGLSKTNVYDISNMVSELAIMNNKTSLHIYVMGVNGEQSLGNPFSPVSKISFNNIDSFPLEIKEVVNNLQQKYFVLDATKLRAKANTYSKELQNLIFRNDIIILIKDCKALNSFSLN